MRQADTKRIDIRQTEQKQINGGLGGSTSLPTYEGMMNIVMNNYEKGRKKCCMKL